MDIHKPPNNVLSRVATTRRFYARVIQFSERRFSLERVRCRAHRVYYVDVFCRLQWFALCQLSFSQLCKNPAPQTLGGINYNSILIKSKLSAH